MYKLYNKDCLEVMKNMEDNSVDLVITDPPYEISTSGAGIYKQKDKKYVKELNEMKDGFSDEILNELCRVMKKINIYISFAVKSKLSICWITLSQKEVVTIILSHGIK